MSDDIGVLLLRQIDGLYDAYQQAWEEARPGQYSSTGMAMVAHGARANAEALIARVEELGRSMDERLTADEWAEQLAEAVVRTGLRLDVNEETISLWYSRITRSWRATTDMLPAYDDGEGSTPFDALDELGAGGSDEDGPQGGGP